MFAAGHSVSLFLLLCWLWVIASIGIKGLNCPCHSLANTYPLNLCVCRSSGWQKCNMSMPAAAASTKAGCLNPFRYPTGTGRRRLALLLHLQIRTIHAQAYASNRTASVLPSPTDIYPPLWDRLQKIEDAIIVAAAETNNPLIRTGTDRIDGGKAQRQR